MAREKVNGTKGCQFGAVLKTEVDRLREEWDHFVKIAYPSSCKEINETIQSLRDKWMNRPSWAVTIILTLLSSLAVGLIVKVLVK